MRVPVIAWRPSNNGQVRLELRVLRRVEWNLLAHVKARHRPLQCLSSQHDGSRMRRPDWAHVEDLPTHQLHVSQAKRLRRSVILLLRPSVDPRLGGQRLKLLGGRVHDDPF
jgi:hypothetical protein